MDIFRDFAMKKPYKINIIVSSTAFDVNALNLIPGIIFLEIILVWIQLLLIQPYIWTDFILLERDHLEIDRR